MNVTEVEMKESTKHCCGNGCCRRDSAEHEGEGRALIEPRIRWTKVVSHRVDTTAFKKAMPDLAAQVHKDH